MNFFGSMGRVAVEPGECPVAEALLVGQRSLVKRAATDAGPGHGDTKAEEILHFVGPYLEGDSMFR